MIQQTHALAPGEAVSMVILPHRSLSRAGLWLFVAAQSVAAGSLALLAALGGNVFAPLFAALELVLVGVCLNRVWRSSTAGEVIVLTPERLEIARTGQGARAVQFHPYWARLALLPGNWRGAPTRLVLRSHGRQVEIGAFLTDAERHELAARLAALLARIARQAPPAAGDNRCTGQVSGPPNFDAR